MSHARIYPGADTRSQWRGNGNVRMSQVNKLLLHTTESASWPSYPNFQPTLTYNPWERRFRQHLPIDGSASTLQNDGNYMTNRANVCQVEIVAYADPAQFHTGRGIHDIPDGALKDLGEFLAWLHREWEVDLFLAKSWPAYPGSAGRNNGVRMGDGEFTHFSGVCGHMHAPGNDHGDPGDLNVGKILAFAHGSPPPPPTPQPTVSLRLLIEAAKSDPHRPQGGTTPGAVPSVRVVERALVREGLLSPTYASDGSFGSLTVTAYAAWQRKCGYSGSDADGIPGEASLKKLGAAQGFRVGT